MSSYMLPVLSSYGEVIPLTEVSTYPTDHLAGVIIINLFILQIVLFPSVLP